jgi:hypothetical protein
MNRKLGNTDYRCNVKRRLIPFDEATEKYLLEMAEFYGMKYVDVIRLALVHYYLSHFKKSGTRT